VSVVRLLKDRDYRRWALLWWQHRKTPRYRSGRVRAFGYDLEVADHLSVVHQLRDIVVDHEYRMPDLGPRPLIVDVGANVGVSVLYQCRMLDDPEIHAFEADPAIFAMLERNVRRHAPRARVHLNHAAAYVSNGTVRFAREGADGGQIQAGKGGDVVEVRSVDLLGFLQGLGRIELLKIDIEGAEALVVPHCKPVFDRIERIFIEVHSSAGQAQAMPGLLTLLQQAGFRLHLQSAEVVRSPFVPAKRHFDNQVNVFAYREQR
jgi:FkbM family methyltransferase